MSIYIAIALGGCLGAVSRYWMSNRVEQWFGGGFFSATLVVNVLGSLVMGFLTVMLVERFPVSDEMRLGMMVGFLGSFTTFSAFAMDTLHWFEHGLPVKACTYILVSVLCSILGAWIGVIAARQLLLR